MKQAICDQIDARKKPDHIKELIVSLMHWRQKWGIKYRKIEVKIKEEVAYVSVTDDYTPQDFEIKS
jgi:hypothetical protein